jgi:putative ABC transport system substrate-binding protein
MKSLQRLLVAAATIFAASSADAQEPAKLRRIGLLMPSTQAATTNLVAAFEEGLREHGYVKGQNVALHYRYSGGHADRVPHLAAELVQAKVEVIVTTTDPVVRTVKQHAGGMPIVMVNTSDPVGGGLVVSLAKPGGNVTGLTNFSPEISGKRIELLKEAVPGLSRVAYLWNPDLAGAAQVYRDIQAAGRTLNVAIQSAEVRRAEDIDVALAALAETPGTALLVQAPNPLLYTRRKDIAQRASEKRMPSMFNRHEYVSAGGLMSYGPNVPHMYRRAAGYVDSIFKGAQPGDLPVEQPSRFELTISLRTARALGLAVPHSVLMRANVVLE